MKLEDALRISASATEIETKMAKLGNELKQIRGVSDGHIQILDNARQAMRALTSSLRGLHEKKPDEAE